MGNRGSNSKARRLWLPRAFGVVNRQRRAIRASRSTASSQGGSTCQLQGLQPFRSTPRLSDSWKPTPFLSSSIAIPSFQTSTSPSPSSKSGCTVWSHLFIHASDRFPQITQSATRLQSPTSALPRESGSNALELGSTRSRSIQPHLGSHSNLPPVLSLPSVSS